MAIEVRKTICLHCPPACGIDVHVDTETNMPVKVEGMPESIVGPICIKAEVIPEWYEHSFKDRILHPMKREGTGFKQISWDEALDLIATKFTEIKEVYGPQAVAYYAGQIAPNRDWSFTARRFWQALESPSFATDWALCWPSRLSSVVMSFGTYAVPTLHRSKCIICWAGNPVTSVPMAGDPMLIMKSKGQAKLLVIDPRKVELGKAADIHAAILPGTDPAFGMGLLNVIISENLYDKEFVEKWTIGFEELALAVKEYTPEKVAEITTVSPDLIREFARTYATNKPATIFWGNTLDNVDNGFQAHRCIQALIAITGNIDVPGGSRLIPLPCFHKIPLGEDQSLGYEDLLPARRWTKMKMIGEDEHPLWCMQSSETPAASLFNAIDTQTPPVKALFIEAGNVIVHWANTNKMRRQLANLDFLVVFDYMMNETAELADLILPARTFLEQQGIYGYVGRPLMVLQNVVIEPPPDTMSDMDFWLKLAQKMGFTDLFPWKTVDDVQNHILSKVGLTLDDLKKNPGGVFFSKAGITWKKYEQDGFRTPSGKVELYSKRLKDMGFDPLPGYPEPVMGSNSKWSKTYPLQLITGTRMLEYNHSMLHTVPSLIKKIPEPFAEIHPDAAKTADVKDNEWMIIETPFGMARMKAKVTEDIHPQVISASHAWWGTANGNLLTDDAFENRDPHSGVPLMRAIACRVSPDIERG